MQHPSVKYGLLAGFISILLTALTYAAGPAFMATWWVGILILVILLLTYVLLSLRLGKEHQGNLNFKDAFVKIFLMCLLAGFLSNLFSILLFNVIDPGFPQKMQEQLVIKTQAMLERMNAPQEKIDDVVDKLKESGNKFTVLAISRGFLFSVMFYALFALIMGSVIKKDKPQFE